MSLKCRRHVFKSRYSHDAIRHGMDTIARQHVSYRHFHLVASQQLPSDIGFVFWKWPPNETNLKIALEVEKCPCLYNFKRSNYSRNDVTEKAWIAISKESQFPGLPRFPNLPGLPNLSNLPSPEDFLGNLLNVTPKELLEIVGDFTFDEVLSNDIQFLLYNKNGSVTALDTYSDKHYVESLTEPIKFIIHGWQAAGDIDFVKSMANSYHSIEIFNVLSVDWSPHAKRNYLHSARGTKKIGEIVGNFVMNLIKNDTRLLPNVHLIGHSLGAQVSAFAGKHIKSLTNGKRIGRITGLDAAAPLFEFPIKLPNDLRLINEDADYVDGIHTNAGFLGFLAPFGHADHYVGLGGPIQSGCEQINMFEAFVCSHIKSHDIYNNTITSKKYFSTPCGNLLRAAVNMCDNSRNVIMGEHTSTKANGDYFIDIDANNQPLKKRGIRNIFPRIPGFNK